MEIYVFSNEQLFNEGEIEDGGYHFWTKEKLHYFIETGHISAAGRNDLMTRGEMLKAVKRGPKTRSEILSSVTYPSVAKKLLNRMCAHEELIYTGGKYGRPEEAS